MIFILLGAVAAGVITACTLEYRKTKKKWKAYEKEVKYTLED